MRYSYWSNELIDIGKAREILGCGLRGIRDYVRSGRLQTINFGYHQMYYKRVDVFWLLHEITEERRERVAKILAYHFGKEENQ